MAGTMSWISINFIVLFGIIIMLPGYCCQNVNILPYPRAYALTDQNLTFQCFSDGNISTQSAWGINGSLGYIRKVNNECVAFDLLNDTSLYNVQCLENGTFVLTILTIKEHDHLAYWSCCLLFNGRYTKWTSTTVFIKVPVSSVNISYPGSSSVTMSENSSVEFGCKASRSRPVPTVSWLIDGGTSTRWDDELISHVVTQSPAAGLEGYFATNGSLTYRPSRAANGKYVFCKSSDHDWFTVLSERKILLNVTYKPDIGPLIMNHTNNTIYYAIRNMQQTLTCSVIGGNPLASLSWSCFTGSEEDLSFGRTVSKRWTWYTSNSGTCKCISRHLGEKETVQLNVTVLFPPTKPVLTYGRENGAILTGSFKVVKGDNFNMHCSSAGNPSPNYLWTGDGRNVSNQVIPVTAITMDRTYTCKVTNTMIPTSLNTVVGSSSSTVSVLVLSRPTHPAVICHYGQTNSISVTTTLKVIKGDSFNVSCIANSVPPSTLSWTGPQTSSSGTLIFTSIQERHDGTYNCTARNYMNRTFGTQEVGQSATSLQIQVLYAPSVTYVNVEPIIEGSALTVECKVVPGNPAKTFYTWQRMSSSLSGNTWQNIPDAVVTDGQLRKQNINRNDAGTYRCTASNMIIPTTGQPQEGSSSRTFILKVLYKASVSSFTEVNHPTMHEVTVSENSSIRLQCEVDSYPGSRIRILKDGETQNSTENTSQISFTNSKVACDTAGIYSCVGFNEYNTEENKASKDLKLFVTCPPRLSSTEDIKSTITSSLDEVTRIKITVIAFPVPKYSDFVWFRWNGSTWETLTNDNTKIINTHGLESTLIFLRVKESDFQRYRVIVRNSVGQFQQKFFLERQAEPTKTEAKAVVNGGMVGGIVGGVVVIIFVVAVAVFCILRKSRFLQRKELERKEELRLGDHSSPVDLQNIQTGSKATTEYANVHTINGKNSTGSQQETYTELQSIEDNKKEHIYHEIE